MEHKYLKERIAELEDRELELMRDVISLQSDIIALQGKKAPTRLEGVDPFIRHAMESGSCVKFS